MNDVLQHILLKILENHTANNIFLLNLRMIQNGYRVSIGWINF